MQKRLSILTSLLLTIGSITFVGPLPATAAATGLLAPAELVALPLTQGADSDVSSVMIDFEPVGGTSTYECSLGAGSLPSGTTLDQQECRIEGETTAVETVTFTLDVMDTANANNVDISVEYTISVEAYSLQNSNLRFGSGGNHSISPSGVLQQPYYYSQGLGDWKPLIYDEPDGYSVDMAFGIGTSGSDWHTNSSVFDLTDNLEENLANSDLTITGWSVDKTNFTQTSTSNGVKIGYGKLISQTKFKTAGGLEFLVHNTFELGQNDNYVKATTVLENVTGANWTNVNLWVGTRDDYVGDDDDPTNTKGNFVEGSFVATPNSADLASVVMTTSANEGSFFYSTTVGANTVIDSCCSFNNIFDIDPLSSPLEDNADDSSYGFVSNLGNVANGTSSASTVWYFGGGVTASLGSIAAAIAQNAGGGDLPIREVPYYGPLSIEHPSKSVSNGPLVVSGTNLVTVSSVSVGGIQTKFEVKVDGTLTVTIPNLAPGRYAIDFYVAVNNVYLRSYVELTGVMPVAFSKVVNVGSFNGKLVLYAANLNGAKISWKVGGKWGAGTATSNYAIFNRPTPIAGATVSVDIYVNGVKTLTKSVVTR